MPVWNDGWFLLAWLNERLGYRENRALLADMAQADEGFDAEGRSYIYARLASGESRLKDVSLTDLARYDANIRVHLTAMNKGRLRPIALRYFQYLAALYTEIFLDWSCNRRGALLRSLNDLVKRRNVNRFRPRGAGNGICNVGFAKTGVLDGRRAAARRSSCT